MEHDIRQQLESASEVFGKERGINYGFFLIGISVQIAAHILHAVQNMPRFTLLGAFKNKMLHKMRHALLVFEFIARSGIYRKTTISHLRQRRFVDDAQAVRQCMQMIARLYFFC